MATVVIFDRNGVRIKEGADARDYQGRTDVAIDPTLPRGIPPHLWVLEDGKIQLPKALGNSAIQLPALKEPTKLNWFKRLINFILRRN